MYAQFSFCQNSVSFSVPDFYHGRGNGGESVFGPVFEGKLNIFKSKYFLDNVIHTRFIFSVICKEELGLMHF